MGLNVINIVIMKGILVNEIRFGKIPDPKNPEQEVLGIEKIII